MDEETREFREEVRDTQKELYELRNKDRELMLKRTSSNRFLIKNSIKDINAMGNKVREFETNLGGAMETSKDALTQASSANDTAEKANKNTNKILWIMIVQIFLLVGATIFDLVFRGG